MLAISSGQFGLVRLVPRVPHSYTPYSYIVLSDSILSANSLYLFFLAFSTANTTLCPHMYSINRPKGADRMCFTYESVFEARRSNRNKHHIGFSSRSC